MKFLIALRNDSIAGAWEGLAFYFVKWYFIHDNRGGSAIMLETGVLDAP
jgi:hypothetical protein